MTSAAASRLVVIRGVIDYFEAGGVMESPVWYVPYLTAPMLMPAIALPDVIVAQFAVGAGILLADRVRRARRGVLLSAGCWKAPSRAEAAGLIATRLLVLGSNAIARPWVQMSELMP